MAKGKIIFTSNVGKDLEIKIYLKHKHRDEIRDVDFKLTAQNVDLEIHADKFVIEKHWLDGATIKNPIVK